MSSAETKEPSMEEILASIRRIISEDGDGAPQPGEVASPDPEPKTKAKPELAVVEDVDEEPLDLEEQAVVEEPEADEAADEEARSTLDDIFEGGEVLELTDELDPPAEDPEPAFSAAPSPAQTAEERLLSERTVETASLSLNSLSGMLMRGYPGSENTLEGLVREMLRPMLKEWLDANLPEVVEKMVGREIARITGREK